MAIARGAGTEILRCHHFENCANTVVKLIRGVQHHVYTVLSVVIYCNNLSGSEVGRLAIQGYDSLEGTTDNIIYLAKVDLALYSTFVFNDKFSFNGHEPTNFTGPMDDAAKQDAIADQGNASVHQYLRYATDGANTKHDITVTFIDQNNE